MLGLGASWFSAGSGCAPRRNAEQAPESQGDPNLPPYEGPLVDPSQIPGDFAWEQRVSAFHGERKGAFDAVLQKDGGELLVLGLTPFRTRGFSLRQKGREFTYEQFVPFDLPFSPEAVLIDIHRAFFFELAGPFPEKGTRQHTYRNESIVDTFSGGRLMTREFSRVSGSDGKLLVEYTDPGYAPLTPPRTTRLDNRAYGYRLEVETSSITDLR